MATTTPNLGLRLSPTLTPDSTFNLQRIDDLAGRFLIEVDQSTAVRSANTITIEPNAASLGGTGIGGEVDVGTSSHSIDLFRVYGPISVTATLLADLAPSAGSLQLQYNSAHSSPGPDATPRQLTFDVQGANRFVTIGGDLSTVGALVTSGSGDLTFVTSGATVATLPAGSYTVVGTTVAQTLTNKTIDAASNTILNLTNASVSPTAGITYSKLNLTGGIVNSDVSPTAAIVGTKISPDFGTQNISTSGSLVLRGSGLATTSVSASPSTSTWSLRLPPNSGTPGLTLLTDGFGVTSWGVSPTSVGEYATTWLSGTSIPITHGLNTKDVLVTTYDVATGTPVYTDYQITGPNTLTVSASSAPPVTGWRVVVFAAGATIAGGSGSQTGVYAVDWMSGTTFSVGHGLNSEDITITVFDKNDGSTVGVDQVRQDVNTVLLTASTAPTGAGRRVVVLSAGGMTRLINTTAPLTGGGSLATDLTLGIPKADGSHDGYLSAADWTLFHTSATSGVSSVNGKTGVVTLLLATDFTDVLPVGHGGTGVAGTATFPASGVVVTETAVETLTNKTLSSPAIDFILNGGTLTLPTSTDTLVGRATTDTLTGKTIDGALNTLTVRLGSDVTGQLPIANGGTGQSTSTAAFNALSPLTTAGDLLYGGVAGAGTRLAAGGATQVLHGGAIPTWSAVSLTTDVSGVLPNNQGGTGVSSTAVFPTSGTVVTEAATETLTNKTLLDTTTTIANTADPTKKFIWNLAGATTGTTTTINVSQTVNRVLTLPNATDTIIGRATTDTVTNKSMSGATNTFTAIPLTTAVTGVLPIANGGTNGSTVTAARSNLGIQSGFSFLTATGVYTTPANITTATQFKFTLVGAGGGGGGIATANGFGCGGGGGGVGVLFISGLTPSTAYAIAIGAAGAGGSNTPAAGGNGGNTTLTISATTYTAGGGVGGPATVSTTVGGTGGTVTNCTISFVGQNGSGTRAAGTQSQGSLGGSTGLGWGIGGQGSVNFIGLDGYPGTGYGGGGAGAGPGTGIGGNGAAGAILVEWTN